MWISKSKERVEDNLAIITTLANSIASQHPDDEDAQWRAQTATALFQDFGITPQAPAVGALALSLRRLADLITPLRSNGDGLDRIGVADAQKDLSGWISGHTRVKQSLKHLETLGLDGPSGWLLQGSLQHLSSNLTSLQLGRQTVLDFSRTPLFDISQQCQKLKVLVVLYKLVTTDDLEKACRAWASTLETLKVDLVVENKHWISKIIPHLRKLKVLSLGRGCYISVDSVNTISETEAPLERISIISVEGLYRASRHGTRMVSDTANEALADMIETHSSTLRHVNIFLCVGKVVIRGYKEAKGLRSLDIKLPDETPSPFIDGLLDSCPELVDFPESFEEYSYRRTEWEARRQLRIDVWPLRKKLLEGRIIDA
ncbi:hypothetical protein FAGAP_4163 [Fusarium agapanthi]|uniref:Uncharacterized protein n=1 Tax=Fusarium agapanthi TaxID=1803897 RepID=A0A9P5EG39_9HYPO|nr:hypothetical protein FAGAP_4163 [Fusarium agapanthi]